MTTVLIIGCGVGGLTLAQGILKNNSKNKTKFNVKLFERDTGPKDRWQGYHIAAKPSGIKSLLNCLPKELSDQLQTAIPNPVEGEEHYDTVMDQDGNTLVSTPIKKFKNLYEFAELKDRKYPTFITYRDKMRYFLLQGLDIQWNKKFVRYELEENGVWAIFDDGTREFGDILVGCDGINSLVRKQKLPTLEINRLGITGTIFDLAPSKDLVERFLKYSGTNNVFRILLGNRGDLIIFLFRLIPIKTKDSQEGQDAIHYRLSILFSCPSLYDNDEQIDKVNDPEKVLNWVKSIVEQRGDSEFNEMIKEFINSAPEKPPKIGVGGQVVDENYPFMNYNPPRKYLLSDIDPNSIERWTIDRVTLLGDAIHAMNPVLGLGTNNALADAEKLSNSLLQWDEIGWKNCIKDYEDEMIKRNSIDVLQSRKVCQNLHTIYYNKANIYLRNFFMKCVGFSLNMYSKIFG
nr:9351_t:CDS:2 [Entrophospora candida]